MHLLSLCSLPLFLLLVQAKKKPQRTPEIYYLTNCFDTAAGTSYAEIDYYKNSSLSAVAGHPTAPDLKDVINPTTDIDYEDSTVRTLTSSPFTLTAMIGEDAYTAEVGSVVGSANASTYKGTLRCERLDRVVLYHPKKMVDCYSDYACVDP